jgi:hypothetical protein
MSWYDYIAGCVVASYMPPADGTRDGDGVWMQGCWHPDRIHHQLGNLVRKPLVDLITKRILRKLVAECLAEMSVEQDETEAPAAEAPVVKINQELLEACRAQHNALDTLMAQLIILTSRHTPEEPFFPSKSGMPWEAMTRAHAVIQEAERLAANPIVQGDTP